MYLSDEWKKSDLKQEELNQAKLGSHQCMEAQQKAFLKAKLEARQKQIDAEKKAQREAMMKPFDWGTPSGKHFANFAFSRFSAFLLVWQEST